MFTCRIRPNHNDTDDGFTVDIVEVATGASCSAFGKTRKAAWTAAKKVLDAQPPPNVQSVASGAELVIPT